MQDMRIALVQMMSKVGDFEANSAIMQSFTDEAARQKADLVCFPETSLTGYDPAHVADLALSRSDPWVRSLFEKADELGIAVCFGMFEREADDGKFFIAQPLHTREETLWHRKTHLGSKEQLTISPGESIGTMLVKGVRIGVQVCWETHFSELATVQRLQGAEAILMPFASGMSGSPRKESWLKYLPARASDNGMYVLAVNALLDPSATASPTAHGGGILAIDPYGEVIGEHFELEDHMLLCDIGGTLPREAGEQSMHAPSFFDGRRSELFARYI